MDADALQTVYLVTIWAGNEPAKQWKTRTKPELLETGTGVVFTDLATGLSVELIGSISVEQYEQGRMAGGLDEREAPGGPATN